MYKEVRNDSQDQEVGEIQTAKLSIVYKCPEKVSNGEEESVVSTEYMRMDKGRQATIIMCEQCFVPFSPEKEEIKDASTE